jgi:hypothetical protein
MAGGLQRVGAAARFYRNSFTCTSYQWRLYVNAPFGGAYYRGATWADQWSCQISS